MEKQNILTGLQYIEEDFQKFVQDIDKVLGLKAMDESVLEASMLRLYTLYIDAMSTAAYDLLRPEDLEQARTLVYLYPDLVLTDVMLVIAFEKDEATEHFANIKKDLASTLSHMYSK